MGKWVISKPYPKYLGNIQTLPNYLLPIKNWVLPRIIGSGRVGYPLPNGYGHPYWCIHKKIPHLAYFQYIHAKNVKTMGNSNLTIVWLPVKDVTQPLVLIPLKVTTKPFSINYKFQAFFSNLAEREHPFASRKAIILDSLLISAETKHKPLMVSCPSHLIGKKKQNKSCLFGMQCI